MTTSVKTCADCFKEKTLKQFYKHPKTRDGRAGACKECAKARTTKRRRETNYAAQRKYESSEKGRSKRRAYTSANLSVFHAIRRGDLERKPCEVCGAETSEAHHPDYAKPLDVMWLCRSHHIQWHHDNGPGLNADAPTEKMDTAA
jgi:hypothetical protein